MRTHRSTVIGSVARGVCSGHRRTARASAAVAAIALVGGVLVGACGPTRPSGIGVAEVSTTSPAGGAPASASEFDHEFLIPAGTSQRIADGEQVEIVPAELIVEVGESVRIVNDDAADHSVGAFFVAAGETLTQQFTSAGVLEGTCSVHPSGRFTLKVVDGS